MQGDFFRQPKLSFPVTISFLFFFSVNYLSWKFFLKLLKYTTFLLKWDAELEWSLFDDYSGSLLWISVTGFTSLMLWPQKLCRFLGLFTPHQMPWRLLRACFSWVLLGFGFVCAIPPLWVISNHSLWQRLLSPAEKNQACQSTKEVMIMVMQLTFLCLCCVPSSLWMIYRYHLTKGVRNRVNLITFSCENRTNCKGMFSIIDFSCLKESCLLHNSRVSGTLGWLPSPNKWTPDTWTVALATYSFQPGFGKDILLRLTIFQTCFPLNLFILLFSPTSLPIPPPPSYFISLPSSLLLCAS